MGNSNLSCNRSSLIGSCSNRGTGTCSPVDLAVSVVPAAREWSLGTKDAYHTSIVLAGEEYSFGEQGIRVQLVGDRFGTPPTHFDKADTKVFDLGYTRHCGEELFRRLEEYFQRGTYDILAKNCNTFTDCALAFLISRRLPKLYSSAETLGQGVPTLINFASGGKYKANPAAQNFDLESVVLRLDENSWRGPAIEAQRFPEHKLRTTVFAF
mmetsp:Transcript_42594/g.92802  ORF Transcript_42594/g.92802 Transcript_42594/m.92802 type:complete len:211 (-) Transcript_42594:104-736(-)